MSYPIGQFRAQNGLWNMKYSQIGDRDTYGAATARKNEWQIVVYRVGDTMAEMKTNYDYTTPLANLNPGFTWMQDFVFIFENHFHRNIVL